MSRSNAGSDLLRIVTENAINRLIHNRSYHQAVSNANQSLRTLLIFSSAYKSIKDLAIEVKTSALSATKDPIWYTFSEEVWNAARLGIVARRPSAYLYSICGDLLSILELGAKLDNLDKEFVLQQHEQFFDANDMPSDSWVPEASRYTPDIGLFLTPPRERKATISRLNVTFDDVLKTVLQLQSTSSILRNPSQDYL